MSKKEEQTKEEEAWREGRAQWLGRGKCAWKQKRGQPGKKNKETASKRDRDGLKGRIGKKEVGMERGASVETRMTKATPGNKGDVVWKQEIAGIRNGDGQKKRIDERKEKQTKEKEALSEEQEWKRGRQKQSLKTKKSKQEKDEGAWK